jgi:hypothetical protein
MDGIMVTTLIPFLFSLLMVKSDFAAWTLLAAGMTALSLIMESTMVSRKSSSSQMVKLLLIRRSNLRIGVGYWKVANLIPSVHHKMSQSIGQRLLFGNYQNGVCEWSKPNFQG